MFGERELPLRSTNDDAHNDTGTHLLMERMFPVKVSVIPPASGFGGNALFEGRRSGEDAHSPNTHWMDSFVALHRIALKQKIVLSTNDVLPVHDADIIVHLAQPKSPRDVIRQKQQ